MSIRRTLEHIFQLKRSCGIFSLLSYILNLTRTRTFLRFRRAVVLISFSSSRTPLKIPLHFFCHLSSKNWIKNALNIPYTFHITLNTNTIIHTCQYTLSKHLIGWSFISSFFVLLMFALYSLNTYLFVLSLICFALVFATVQHAHI